VGVRWVTGLIGFVIGLIGFVLGLGVGFSLVTLFNSNTIALIIGIGLGAMIFFAFAIVASIISSYTMTAYNTCLFLWARDVEKAQVQGSLIPVTAPAPLAAALA
jgi:ABC-type transport system involved in multi-copper enzyme maturation permease subunit